ncbi:putative late blight resistance protein homolog R1A-3 [Ipomoea triloba]|uniref:putative late blight resistance protein homolog R1A-3 n=1 Tax=Ipomoea triloba TaxID=35885 RepID=UPI00125E546B|nr:putative late blight resistance protein homolog R1A-3 [Ipomoea triloba]
MACVAVTSLVRTLELEFMQPQLRPIVQDKGLISGNEELIRSLHQKLINLMEQLDDHEQRIHGVEAIKRLETKLRDVAFRVEDEIEFLIADLYVKNTPLDRINLRNFHRPKGKSRPYCHNLHLILQRAIKDINPIEEKLVIVKNKYKRVTDLQGTNTSTALDSFQHASHYEGIMVGKNDEFKTIKDMLTLHPSKQREVVTIKGMGGIGKTTLARKSYKDSSIRSHFDKRAWVVVSQFYNKRQMLICLHNSILKQSNAESLTDEELEEQIYRCLKRQKYLVVMDDVWSGESWDDINACFPDDGNGSRVLLTTRLEVVANCVSSGNDFSHQMNLLDHNESWTLFHRKALLEGVSQGVEFEMIGRPIVEKCRGLPLAIVVVGGLFSKLNTLDDWKSVAKALDDSSTTTTIVEVCSKILSLSYNHLPHNFKACFLYLGIFPEDEEIYAKRLARLWGAEGLIKASKNESLEMVGQKHIKELIDRNLILLSEQSSCGTRIKTFKMHDVLHAFCVREAQNESLLHVVNENGTGFAHKSFRWLSITSSKLDISRLYSYPKTCRSMFEFSTYQITKLVPQNFETLRVLYTTDVKPKPVVYPRTVHLFTPIHLRYLSSTIGKPLNSKSSNAWNLQTLCEYIPPPLINSNSSFDLNFPHLSYYHCDQINCLDPLEFVHQNLESISELGLFHCTKELFTSIPHVKKVGIVGDGSSSTLDWVRCRIGNLAYLQQLERLKIYVYHGCFSYSISGQIARLKNIKKLSFYNTNFLWEEMGVLSKLPRLEVMKMKRWACKGQKWGLKEDERFCRLVFLKFDGVDLERWEVNDDNFPKLERLILYDCSRLEEIPSSFEDIQTLKSIKLRRCLLSAVTSAKKIEESQHDYGNTDMVVIEENTICQNPVLPVIINGDENRNVVVNNNGGNGNIVAHSRAPMNVGSQNGVSIKEYIPTMRVSSVPSGSANIHEKSNGFVTTTWSEDYCSTNNNFNHNQGKSKRKLVLKKIV